MGIYKGFRPVLILIILLSGAIQALGQIDTLDSKVCIGTTYKYRVEGSPGSIYIWKVNGIQQKTPNDYLEYTWTRTGFFIVEVQEHQNDCEGELKLYGVKVGLDEGCGCKLFIPNAFSPNGDGNRDYFEIYCILPFPNAHMYIFDQLGNKIFDKAHYGNIEFWGNNESAWWYGIPDSGSANAKNERVAIGTYYYALDLGNGVVKKSFVFVSY